MTKIYYIGYDATHNNDFIFDIPEGYDFWLLLLTQTPALFYVDGELLEYPADSAVLYPPNHKILYRACGENYANDWMRFDSTESYLMETTLPLGVPFSPSDPAYCHKLFQLITAEHCLEKDYKEMNTDYLFRILFNKLSESIPHEKKSIHYRHLLALRNDIHNNPSYPWTICAMAEQLHISTGYLQSVYKDTFGISCMSDVINSRIHLAKEYLIHSTCTIKELALLCGYNNIEHFNRQFQKHTGFAPAAFRNCFNNRIHT